MWMTLWSASDGGVAYCEWMKQMKKWTFGLGDRQTSDGMRNVVLAERGMPRVFSWSLSHVLNLEVSGLAYVVWAET
jgi:hypothetical protein